MTYDLWQVRDKNKYDGNGSMIWLYAVRQDQDILNFVDSSTQSLYNRKGTWEIKGFGDYPKFFRIDYRDCKENVNFGRLS
jgi:hypothetical protein